MGGTVNIVTGTPFSVTFNNATNTFTITGGDFTSMFVPNAILTAIGGTPNGGYQTVTSSTFTSGNTVVTVASYSVGTAYPGPATFTTGSGTIILMTNIASPSDPWSLQFNDLSGSNTFKNILLGATTTAIAYGSSQSYHTTNGGTSWTTITPPATAHNIFFNGSVFYSVAASNSGTNYLYYSTDGSSWTNIPVTGFSGAIQILPFLVVTTGDLFLTQSTGSGNVNLWKVPFGTTTATQHLTNAAGPSPESNGNNHTIPNGIVSNNDGSILVGTNILISPHNVYTSTDTGITWTATGFTFPTSPEILKPTSTLWNGTEWCIVGQGQTTGKYFAYTSTDGTTWTQQYYNTSGPPYASNQAIATTFGSTFVTSDGGTNVGTSSDGVTWSGSVPSGITFIQGVSESDRVRIYAFGDGIDESIDGTTWTAYLSSFNGDPTAGINDVNSNGTISLAAGNDASNNGVIYVRSPS